MTQRGATSNRAERGAFLAPYCVPWARMAKTDCQSVAEYLAAFPDDVRPVLERVRGAIRKALSGADETISYQMPTYKLYGTYVVYFAGWKHHYSLYPASRSLVTAFQDELAPYEIRKGTIRFPLSEPVPVKLIGRIAKFLAKEAAERADAKRASVKKLRKSC